MIIPADIPPDLLDKTLPELLKLVALQKLTGKILDWATQRIKELWEKREYGFTPEPDVASGLQKISKSDAYRRMKECIGNHRFLGLVKLGFRVDELNEQGNTTAIAKIKSNVFEKHGVEGIRILTMGTTGVLTGIIQYLSDMKLKNDYSQAIMADHFEKIIKNWMQITIFHQAVQGQRTLEKGILTYMKANYDIFFVFSMGTASEQATKLIAQLKKDGIIKKNGYMFDLYRRREVAGRVMHTWVFQNIKEWRPFV
ncbi:MAG: hypothetical protein O8C66_07880 [Candidatus Methanoperedens sp.]|nr:hypothetical protein [Candidatus Methanoperedens sp.]MCZ7370414.1 hypothetical protein [Candidatus Methanoperedens sp.]